MISKIESSYSQALNLIITSNSPSLSTPGQSSRSLRTLAPFDHIVITATRAERQLDAPQLERAEDNLLIVSLSALDAFDKHSNMPLRPMLHFRISTSPYRVSDHRGNLSQSPQEQEHIYRKHAPNPHLPRPPTLQLFNSHTHAELHSMIPRPRSICVRIDERAVWAERVAFGYVAVFELGGLAAGLGLVFLGEDLL